MNFRVLLILALIILIWPVIQGIITLCTSWQGHVIFGIIWAGAVFRLLRSVSDFIFGPL